MRTPPPRPDAIPMPPPRARELLALAMNDLNHSEPALRAAVESAAHAAFRAGDAFAYVEALAQGAWTPCPLRAGETHPFLLWPEPAIEWTLASRMGHQQILPALLQAAELEAAGALDPQALGRLLGCLRRQPDLLQAAIPGLQGDEGMPVFAAAVAATAPEPPELEAALERIVIGAFGGRPFDPRVEIHPSAARRRAFEAVLALAPPALAFGFAAGLADSPAKFPALLAIDPGLALLPERAVRLAKAIARRAGRFDRPSDAFSGSLSLLLERASEDALRALAPLLPKLANARVSARGPGLARLEAFELREALGSGANLNPPASECPQGPAPQSRAARRL